MTHQVPPAAGPVGYRERLKTPLWWYPAGAVVGVLLGAEFAFIIPAWLTWLPIVLSALLAMLIVWRLSSATVRVSDDQLIAGDRQLALSRIVQAIDLTPTEVRRVVGRHGDPLAYNFIRSWVGPGVQLILAEPPEAELAERMPEPYWLVSTRHPQQLMATLSSGLTRPTG